MPVSACEGLQLQWHVCTCVQFGRSSCGELPATVQALPRYKHSCSGNPWRSDALQQGVCCECMRSSLCKRTVEARLGFGQTQTSVGRVLLGMYCSWETHGQTGPELCTLPGKLRSLPCVRANLL